MTGAGVAIGIDAGGSKTDAVLVDANCVELARATAGGANLRSIDRHIVESNLASVISPLLAGQRVRAICVGAAGAGREADRDALREVLKWAAPPRMMIIVMHDGEIALRAATSARPAMVVIAGTGSLAYGERADGTSARAGGYGSVIGDPGSGYAIGMAAIQCAARAFDGIEPIGMLAKAVANTLNAKSASDLTEAVDHPPPDVAEVASLAGLVAEASRSGDAAAQEIIAGHARLLGSLAAQVARAIRDGRAALPVALSGGAFEAIPTLAETVSQAVAASGECEIIRPQKTPAAGAAAIALERLHAAHAL
jgi:N-acetylglucosamine kinase-like BadF-type ATPase